MLLENQWFWLVMIAFSVIMYLIISKVCETIENIQMAKHIPNKFEVDGKYVFNSNGMNFNGVEELDAFISNLIEFRDKIIENETEDNE